MWDLDILLNYVFHPETLYMSTPELQGNEQFGQGFWHEAAQFYTEALDICPLVYTYDRFVSSFSMRANMFIQVIETNFTCLN